MNKYGKGRKIAATLAISAVIFLILEGVSANPKLSVLTIPALRSFQWASGIGSRIDEVYFFIINGAATIMRDYSNILPNIMRSCDIMKPVVNDGSFFEMSGFIMRMIMPLVVFAILFDAIKMIISSHDANERAQIKSELHLLLIGLVLMPLSPHIYQLLIEISWEMTASLLGGEIMLCGGGSSTVTGTYQEVVGDRDFGPTMAGIYKGITDTRFLLIMCCSNILITMALSLIFIRHIIVIMCGIMMPLTIFLYSFGFTKSVGRKFLKYSISWALVPIIMAFWIIATSIMIMNIGGDVSIDKDTGMFIAMSFLSMIIISPLMITGALEFVGSTIAASGQFMKGMGGAVVTGVGTMMAAKSPEAMVTAGIMSATPILAKGGGKALRGTLGASTKAAAAGKKAAKAGSAVMGKIGQSGIIAAAGAGKIAQGFGWAGSKIGRGLKMASDKTGLTKKGAGLALGAYGWAKWAGHGTANIYRGTRRIAKSASEGIRGVGRSMQDFGRSVGKPMGDLMKKVGDSKAFNAAKAVAADAGSGARVGGSLFTGYLGQAGGLFREGDSQSPQAFRGLAQRGALKGTGTGRYLQAGAMTKMAAKSIGNYLSNTGIGRGLAKWKAMGGLIGVTNRKFDHPFKRAKDSVSNEVGGALKRMGEWFNAGRGVEGKGASLIGGKGVSGLWSNLYQGSRDYLNQSALGRAAIAAADDVASRGLGSSLVGIAAFSAKYTALSMMVGMSAIGGGAIPAMLSMGLTAYAAYKIGGAMGLGQGIGDVLRTTNFGRGFALAINSYGAIQSAQGWAQISGQKGGIGGFITGKAVGIGLDLAGYMMITLPALGASKGVQFAMTGGLSGYSDAFKLGAGIVKAPFRAGRGIMKFRRELSDISTGTKMWRGNQYFYDLTARKFNEAGYSGADLANASADEFRGGKNYGVVGALYDAEHGEGAFKRLGTVEGVSDERAKKHYERTHGEGSYDRLSKEERLGVKQGLAKNDKLKKEMMLKRNPAEDMARREYDRTHGKGAYDKLGKVSGVSDERAKEHYEKTHGAGSYDSLSKEERLGVKQGLAKNDNLKKEKLKKKAQANIHEEVARRTHDRKTKRPGAFDRLEGKAENEARQKYDRKNGTGSFDRLDKKTRDGLISNTKSGRKRKRLLDNARDSIKKGPKGLDYTHEDATRDARHQYQSQPGAKPGEFDLLNSRKYAEGQAKKSYEEGGGNWDELSSNEKDKKTGEQYEKNKNTRNGLINDQMKNFSSRATELGVEKEREGGNSNFSPTSAQARLRYGAGMNAESAQLLADAGVSLESFSRANPEEMVNKCNKLGITDINKDNIGKMQQNASNSLEELSTEGRLRAATLGSSPDAAGATGTKSQGGSDKEDSKLSRGMGESEESKEGKWFEIKQSMLYGSRQQRTKSTGEQLEEMLEDKDEQPSR